MTGRILLGVLSCLTLLSLTAVAGDGWKCGGSYSHSNDRYARDWDNDRYADTDSNYYGSAAHYDDGVVAGYSGSRMGSMVARPTWKLDAARQAEYDQIFSGRGGGNYMARSPWASGGTWVWVDGQRTWAMEDDVVWQNDRWMWRDDPDVTFRFDEDRWNNDPDDWDVSVDRDRFDVDVDRDKLEVDPDRFNIDADRLKPELDID